MQIMIPITIMAINCSWKSITDIPAANMIPTKAMLFTYQVPNNFQQGCEKSTITEFC